MEELRQISDRTVSCLKDSKKLSSGTEMWWHRVSLIRSWERSTLLSTRSEKWTPVVHSYCLFLARELDGNRSLFHDEDTKSTHNHTSHDVFICAVRGRIFKENWKINLNSKRKRSEQHRREDNWLYYHCLWPQTVTFDKNPQNQWDLGTEPPWEIPLGSYMQSFSSYSCFACITVTSHQKHID